MVIIVDFNNSTALKQDIQSYADIQFLVEQFYTRVRANALIGPIFIGVIKDKWPQHLLKLSNFWNTVLFNEPGYRGSPFAPHAQMPLKQAHFTTWITLFTETVDQHFAGEKATEAKWRAEKMAEMFLIKIEFYRKQRSESK